MRTNFDYRHVDVKLYTGGVFEKENWDNSYYDEDMVVDFNKLYLIGSTLPAEI